MKPTIMNFHDFMDQMVEVAELYAGVPNCSHVAAQRAGERLRRNVEGERRAVDLDDRQATAVDGDAVAHGDVRNIADADVDSDAQARPRWSRF